MPLLVTDADDATALAEIARSTKVIVTTVGPYLKYGEPLVKACAEAGTHYCDLTGEPEFVDAMWLKYHETAKRTGAKLVHCCGFDSIPFDLGVWFLEDEAIRRFGKPLPRVKGRVRKMQGGASGGTIASLMATVKAAATNLALVTFSRSVGNLDGQVMAFFVMVVAAAEVVVGLAIIVTIFRTRRSASIDEPNLLKY